MASMDKCLLCGTAVKSVTDFVEKDEINVPMALSVFRDGLTS